MKTYFWRLLLVAGAAAAASPTALPPPQKALSYEQAARLAVGLYNKKAGDDITYKLLEAEPRPDWDANSQSAQEVDFTIQETVCLAEEERPEEECDFRDEGSVKECSAYYFLDDAPPVAFVTCDIEMDEPQAQRVKRSWKKTWKKIKKPFQCALKHGTVILGGVIPF